MIYFNVSSNRLITNPDLYTLEVSQIPAEKNLVLDIIFYNHMPKKSTPILPIEKICYRCAIENNYGTNN